MGISRLCVIDANTERRESLYSSDTCVIGGVNPMCAFLTTTERGSFMPLMRATYLSGREEMGHGIYPRLATSL